MPFISAASLRLPVANFLNRNFLDASARVCDLSLGPETFFISVSSQEELDTKLGNCTTILGSIFIEGNYTGSLRLENVTKIDGRIFSSTSISYVPPASLITSIEFPNLKTVGSIQVSNAPSIDSVSFPILSKADMIYLGEIGKANVSFPSLITAGSLTISGNTTRYVATPAIPSAIYIFYCKMAKKNLLYLILFYLLQSEFPTSQIG